MISALHSRHFLMRGAHSPQVIWCLQGKNMIGVSVSCEHTRHSIADADAEFEFPAVLVSTDDDAPLSSLAPSSSLEMNSSCRIALDAGSC